MRKKRLVNTIFLSVILIVLWVFLFSGIAGYIGTRSVSEQREGLLGALERDITCCYALEGRYPPDLQYLRDHYGLSYNTSLFYVDYRPVASNIRPSYVVIDLTE